MRPGAILCAWLLAGCTVAPPQASWHWERSENGTAEAYRLDLGQCEAQAWSAPTLLQVAMVRNACMTGKGWRQVQDSN